MRPQTDSTLVPPAVPAPTPRDRSLPAPGTSLCSGGTRPRSCGKCRGEGHKPRDRTPTAEEAQGPTCPVTSTGPLEPHPWAQPHGAHSDNSLGVRLPRQWGGGPPSVPTAAISLLLASSWGAPVAQPVLPTEGLGVGSPGKSHWHLKRRSRRHHGTVAASGRRGRGRSRAGSLPARLSRRRGAPAARP